MEHTVRQRIAELDARIADLSTELDAARKERRRLVDGLHRRPALTPEEVTEDQRRRIARRITHHPESGCWLWHGSLHQFTIGQRTQERTAKPARIVWVLETGRSLAPHVRLTRTCSSPTCVAPHHHEFP